MKDMKIASITLLAGCLLLYSNAASAQATQPISAASINATNNLNQVSLEQLASQLENLKLSVDQTLPMLSAFNQQAGSTNGLTGAFSGLLSGVLRKNTNSSTATPAGQRLTNVLSALGALVTTNNQGSVTLDRTTQAHLATLERDLRPVAEVMRNLNLLANTNTTGVPQVITAPGGGLTPTGR